MKNLRIALLKRKLKSDYLNYLQIADEYNCGATLTEYISPDLYKTKERINITIKKLRKLDKTCKLEDLK